MANPNQKIIYTQLFINNQFVNSTSGKQYSTVNPANGKALALVAEADNADVLLAVKAAQQADCLF